MKGSRYQSAEERTLSFSWVDLAFAYWYLLGDLKWRYLLLQGILIIVLFYQIVPPLIVGMIVDFFTRYTPGDSLTPFYTYTLGLGISFVVVSFIRLSVKLAIGDCQSQIIYETKVRAFERLLGFSVGWHLQEAAGAKAQRIISGVEAFRYFGRRLQNEIMRTVVTFVGMTGVFLVLRPSYALFFCAYFIAFWAIINYFYRRIQHENTQYYLSLEKAGGSYIDGLSNVVTLKNLGAASDFSKHIASNEEKVRDHDNAQRKISNNQWKAFQILNGLCYGGFLFLVGRDIIGGAISAGALVIFYGYLHNLIRDSADILEVYEEILKAKSGIGRMMTILWGQSEAGAGKKKFPRSWRSLEFRDASFAYRDDGSGGALYGINLSIKRNEKIGIVGKTGSGKSTIAKVLAGLFPLRGGSYAVGGVSFFDISRDEQLRHVTLILQETEIFNFTLRENITLMRSVDTELLLRAIQFSQLKELVAKLPQGLDTLVGEKGYHLSGGERQRVGVARALCRPAEILIFDEATSSLDSQTEKKIQTALEAGFSEKTLILIAHRIATLENVDVIYVMENGRIVESGTYTQLSSNPRSVFHTLYMKEKLQ